MGIISQDSARWRCSSNPFIPGMVISSIRHPVAAICPDCRNSSADAKASARIPELRRSLRVELLTEGSSSTRDTSCSSTHLYLFRIHSRPSTIFCSCHDNTRLQHENSTVPWGIGVVTVLWGQVEGDLFLACDSELFGHSNQIGERFRAHLLHDVSGMKFNRSLGGGEFAGKLFVEVPGDDQAITSRSRGVSSACNGTLEHFFTFSERAFVR